MSSVRCERRRDGDLRRVGSAYRTAKWSGCLADICTWDLVCSLRHGTSLLGRHIRVGFGTRDSSSHNHNHKQDHSHNRELRRCHNLKQEPRKCIWTAVLGLSREAADAISDTPGPTLVRSRFELCSYTGHLLVIRSKSYACWSHSDLCTAC